MGDSTEKVLAVTQRSDVKAADTAGRLLEENVITLENYNVKMPQIDHNNGEKNLYGLVDMGSNGIRFSISDLSPPRTRHLPCIYSERAGISLYDALHAPSGKPFFFSPETVEEVTHTLKRYREICQHHGVKQDNILVFATEAMRTAKNKNTMLESIKKATDLSVNILAPAMESMFGAMGARTGFHHVNGLFMDLGGGSVQMTYMNSEDSPDNYHDLAALAAASMPFGAARMTDAFKLHSTAEAAKSELNTQMKRNFEGLKSQFTSLQRQLESEDGVRIYLCGGGFRGYGSMLMHTDPIKPYPFPFIGGYVVPGGRFVKWEDMLEANKEDGKIFGLSKRRRKQFPAIVAVIRALTESVPKIKEVIFCAGGNREGVLFMKLLPVIREMNPLDVDLLNGQLSKGDKKVSAFVTSRIGSCIPPEMRRPELISDDLIHYVTQNMYANLGGSDKDNCTKYLHSPISGDLAAIPGFTHRSRALFALAMCARWGSDLGKEDKAIFRSMQSLVGPELAYMCDLLGSKCRDAILNELLLRSSLQSRYIFLVPALCRPAANRLELHGYYIAAEVYGRIYYHLNERGHHGDVYILLQVVMGLSLITGLADTVRPEFFKNVGEDFHLNWKLCLHFLFVKEW